MSVRAWLKTRIERYREFYLNPEPGQVLGLFSRWAFPVSNSDLGLPGYLNNHWDWRNNPEAQSSQPQYQKSPCVPRAYA